MISSRKPKFIGKFAGTRSLKVEEVVLGFDRNESKVCFAVHALGEIEGPPIYRGHLYLHKDGLWRHLTITRDEGGNEHYTGLFETRELAQKALDEALKVYVFDEFKLGRY